MDKENQKSGYSKRPLWQWILIYIIVGGILYFLIYKFVIAKNGRGYNSPSSSSGGYSQQSAPGGY